MYFLSMDLSVIPSMQKYIIIPIFALIATILLCLFQNKLNVLQREEEILSKLLTGAFTTIITVYFVFLDPIGVGIYWIIGDILAIIQQYILNLILSPEKYIDYDAFDKIKKQKKEKIQKEKIEKKRAKKDYKKFFESENIDSMKLMFYSEQSGFFKYFKGMIEYILENSDITIHYVTSDIKDKIFEFNNSRIKPYYINTNLLIPLFMKLESDIVVMTTPDLQNLYLKRSIVKKDIEYIFSDHGLGSVNLLYRQNALNYYDTVFAKNIIQEKEVKALEKIQNVKRKKIVETGYTLIEDMIKEYSTMVINNQIKTIVIAPSWQEDNIMESCIHDILEKLLSTNYKIIVRPHPQYIKRNPKEFREFELKYKNNISDRFIIENDFSSNSTIYMADLIITDWSGVGYEFSFSTTKPCLFVNTKMKILNPNYKDIDVQPMDLEVRKKVGKCIEKENISNIINIVDDLIVNQSKYMRNNELLRNEYIFNLGKAAQIEGQYIIDRIKGE